MSHDMTTLIGQAAESCVKPNVYTYYSSTKANVKDDKYTSDSRMYCNIQDVTV